MGKHRDVSVVLPAHNEAEYLEGAVTSILAGLRQRQASFEVLIVENGSNDETATIASRLAVREPEVRALSCPIADYGAAIGRGLSEARGASVVKFDVDYVDLVFLDRALEQLAGGAAIVLGTKRGAGASDTRAPGRRLATATLVSLLKVGFGLRASDTHGLQAFERAAISPLAAQVASSNDLFDTELVLRAERSGLCVAELPVAVADIRPARTPLARRVPRTLRGLAALRLRLWQEALVGRR